MPEMESFTELRRFLERYSNQEYQIMLVVDRHGSSVTISLPFSKTLIDRMIAYLRKGER